MLCLILWSRCDFYVHSFPNQDIIIVIDFAFFKNQDVIIVSLILRFLSQDVIIVSLILRF